MERKDNRLGVHFKVSPENYKLIERAARRDDMRPGPYARQAALQKAREEARREA